jgi:hypothetical protein
VLNHDHNNPGTPTHKIINLKKIHFNFVNPHAAILKTPVWGLPASTALRRALFRHLCVYFIKIYPGARYAAVIRIADCSVPR